MKENYRHCLTIGEEFQDWVTEQCLIKHNFILQCYTSKDYQYKKGESLTGIEIKHDSKYPETGNLYIETERWDYKHNCFVPTDIQRPGVWGLIIGTREKAWFFSTTVLMTLKEKGKLKEAETNKEGDNRVKGFLFPVKYADQYCNFVLSEDG